MNLSKVANVSSLATLLEGFFKKSCHTYSLKKNPNTVFILIWFDNPFNKSTSNLITSFILSGHENIANFFILLIIFQNSFLSTNFGSRISSSSKNSAFSFDVFPKFYLKCCFILPDIRLNRTCKTF